MAAGAENDPGWLDYWRENMEALGIPVPSTAFPNYALVVASIRRWWMQHAHTGHA